MCYYNYLVRGMMIQYFELCDHFFVLTCYALGSLFVLGSRK